MSHCEDDAVSMIVSCYCSEWLNIQLLCSCNQSIRFEITNLQLLFCFPHSELVTNWPRTLSPGFVSMKTRDRISVVSLLILQLILCILLSLNAFQDRGLYPFWISYSILFIIGILGFSVI